MMNDETDDLPPLPEGFAYATSEELALALGAKPDEAKAMQTRLERILGATLEAVPPKRSFSDFIRNASPGEKEAVYKQVMKRASERQRAVLNPTPGVDEPGREPE